MQTAVAAVHTTEQTRAVFLANVDCVAADTFFNSSMNSVKRRLLEATLKYNQQLDVGKAKALPETHRARSWIDFSPALLKEEGEKMQPRRKSSRLCQGC